MRSNFYCIFDVLVHEDPEAACDNVKTVIRPCALKARKEEFKCPVAIFGPPNPSQLPMYPKQLVCLVCKLPSFVKQI